MQDEVYEVGFLHPPVPPHPYYTLWEKHPRIRFLGLRREEYGVKGDDEKTSSHRGGIMRSLVRRVPLPTISLARPPGRIILAAQLIPLRGDRPVILDIDYPPALARYDPRVYASPIFRRTLHYLFSMRVYCPTFWTRRAKMMLENLLPRGYFSMVLYPPIPHVTHARRKPRRITRLLLVSRALDMKGGEDLLEAFRLLKREFPWLKLTLIGEASDMLREKIRKTRDVTYHSFLPRERLMRDVYPNADLFVYPTLQDIYGYAILEAYAFGIPVIAYEDYAIREIVRDGRTGLILSGYRKKWYDEHGVKRIETYQDLLQRIPQAERKRMQQELAGTIRMLIRNEDKYHTLLEGVRREGENGELSYKKWEEKVEWLIKKCQDKHIREREG